MLGEHMKRSILYLIFFTILGMLSGYADCPSSDRIVVVENKLNNSHNEGYVIVDDKMQWLHTPVPYKIDKLGVERVCFDGEYYSIEHYCYEDESGYNRCALYIEPSGLFTDFIYGEVFPFEEGLAAACKYGPHAKFGYIDLSGSFVIPCIWEWAESFSDGRAIVSYETAEGYGNLYINTLGEVVGICNSVD